MHDCNYSLNTHFNWWNETQLGRSGAADSLQQAHSSTRVRVSLVSTTTAIQVVWRLMHYELWNVTLHRTPYLGSPYCHDHPRRSRIHLVCFQYAPSVITIYHSPAAMKSTARLAKRGPPTNVEYPGLVYERHSVKYKYFSYSMNHEYHPDGVVCSEIFHETRN